MNGLTQRNKVDNQREAPITDGARRWRAWARAIACSLPVRGPIIRRRAPLKLAFLQSRSLVWLVQRNTSVHLPAKNSCVVIQPIMRLSLLWTRTAARWNRSFAPGTRGELTPAVPGTISGVIPVPAPDFIHRWILREQHMESKSLLRAIVDRTRRLEECIRLEKRPVARGAVPSAAMREPQDAARRAGPDWWKLDTPMRSPRTASPPAINFEQIAETVMQRIDQRLRAWRERMGRM